MCLCAAIILSDAVVLTRGFVGFVHDLVAYCCSTHGDGVWFAVVCLALH